MNRSLRAPLFLVVLLLVGLVQTATPQTNAPAQFKPSPKLQAVVDRALRETLAKFAGQKRASKA